MTFQGEYWGKLKQLQRLTGNDSLNLSGNKKSTTKIMPSHIDKKIKSAKKTQAKLAAAPAKIRPLVNPGGRPPKPVDYDKIRDLSSKFHTDDEIAVELGIGITTFQTKKETDPKILEAILEGISKGKGSLRSKQLKKALAGDNTMLIWLGKQYLGQKDTVLHSTDPHAPIQHEHKVIFATAAEAAAAWKKALKGT